MKLIEVAKIARNLELGEWSDVVRNEHEELLLRWNLAISHQRGVEIRNPSATWSLNELILYSKIRGNQKHQIDGSDKLNIPVDPGMLDELTIPKKYAIDSSSDKIVESYERAMDELGSNFVMKTNHDSGGVRFVHSFENFRESIETLERARQSVYGLSTCETSYFAINRRLFIEKNVTAGSDGAVDIKCHCYEGEIFLFQIILDRYQTSPTREILLDANLHELRGLLDANFRKARLADVPGVATILGENLQSDVGTIASSIGGYVRVDLLVGSTGVSLGETTFFPYGGFYPKQVQIPSIESLIGRSRLVDWSTDIPLEVVDPRLSARQLLTVGFGKSEGLSHKGRLNYHLAQTFVKSLGF